MLEGDSTKLHSIEENWLSGLFIANDLSCSKAWRKSSVITCYSSVDCYIENTLSTLCFALHYPTTLSNSPNSQPPSSPSIPERSTPFGTKLLLFPQLFVCSHFLPPSLLCVTNQASIVNQKQREGVCAHCHQLCPAEMCPKEFVCNAGPRGHQYQWLDMTHKYSNTEQDTGLARA